MPFLLLVLGLALWVLAHIFKRIAPGARARMGEKGKGAVAIALFASLVLIVLGYRGMDFIIVWSPPAFMFHINNTLMLIAVWLFAASGTGAWPATKIRHPQLTAVKTWAVAHLLVNGDLASVILFGGLLGWAVLEVVLINRAEPDWTPPEPKPGAVLKAVVGTVVVFASIALVHWLLGRWPFPV